MSKLVTNKIAAQGTDLKIDRKKEALDNTIKSTSGVINSIFKQTGVEQIKNDETNTALGSVSQQVDSMNKEMVEMSKAATESLAKSLFPNEKPVFFESDQLGAQAERLTAGKMLEKLSGGYKPTLFQSRALQQAYYPIRDLSDTDELEDEQYNPDKEVDLEIYDVQIQKYGKNPYDQDPDFLKQFQAQGEEEEESLSEDSEEEQVVKQKEPKKKVEVIPNMQVYDPSISVSSSKKAGKLDSLNGSSINMQFPKKDGVEATCMQKQLADWGTGDCTKSEVYNERTKVYEISCECTLFSATTMMNGVMDIFATSAIGDVFST